MARISRRTLLGSSLIAPFVIAAPARAQTDPRPSLTVAVAELPTGLEPASELSNVGTRITYTVYDTLIRRDFLGSPDGGGSRLRPHLAEAWERGGPDQLTLRLRRGVKFHNGDELTAEDVAFTFAEGRMWGTRPQIPQALPYFGILAGVDVLDTYTVRIRTRVPDVMLEQRLASWCAWIVNKRTYAQLGPTGYARNPVGTGPYKFRRMQSDDRIELEAFDDYWMGRPTARAATFRAIPEVASRTAGLAAGEFDIITNVPPDQIGTLERMPNVEARSVVLANCHCLIFNQKDPVLADKRVRQALSLAIDRQLLVESLWLGRAVVPASHNYPEYGDMFIPGRRLAHDPARARALLREAGYAGQPIVYRTQPNYYTNALPAAQILIEMWKAVGINASLQIVENSAQMRTAGQQITNWSNSTRLPDPLGALWIAWGPGGEVQNRREWSTAQAFNETGRALEAETNPARRRALFARMLDIWEDECPGTILYQPLETYGVRKSVRWRPYTFYFMDLRPDNLAFG
jgi:peptide/nickel transport system substrate-binding protein